MSGHRVLCRVAACLALAMALAGCSGSGSGASSTPSAADLSPSPSAVGEPTVRATSTSAPTPATSIAPSPSASGVTSGPATADEVTLDATCTLVNPERADLPEVRVSHPAAWLAPGGVCGWFDPDPSAGRPGAGVEAVDIDVRWKVDAVAFDVAVAPSPTIDVTSRTASTVAGRDAQRVVGTATGEGFFDAGVETTTWIVALASAPDASAVVGAVADVPGVDYATAVAALDAMAETLTFGAGDAG